VQSLWKCIAPLPSNRADEWILWSYPIDAHYCPPATLPLHVPIPLGPPPPLCPPLAPPSASPALLHPLAQPAVLPTTPLLMMQQTFKPLPPVKQRGTSSTSKLKQPTLQDHVHVPSQGTAFLTAKADAAPKRSALELAKADAAPKRSAVEPHKCPHHTSCVVGKCTNCLCDKCKKNQVSGKRIVKQRTND
jgi:hypothetical protein